MSEESQTNVAYTKSTLATCGCTFTCLRLLLDIEVKNKKIVLT